MGRYHYVFPRWSNTFVVALIMTAAVAPLYVVFIVAYGFSPVTTDAMLAVPVRTTHTSGLSI